MTTKNELVGMITQSKDDKCPECWSIKDLIQFEKDEIIKGLKVTKCYLLCKECAIAKGIKLPKGI